MALWNRKQPTRIDDVIEAHLVHYPEADTEIIRRAYVYSGQAHKGQTRRTGEPYLTHPLAVAMIAANLRLDTVSVCAALLHDTVEDTPVTVADLTAEFGAVIAQLVEDLTKLEKVKFRNEFEANAENYRKLLIAMNRDSRVILVKLCDRLHNMYTLSAMTDEAKQRISLETQEIYAPLAHWYSLHVIASELEDLSFRYYYPDEFAALVAELDQTKAQREIYIEEVSAQLEEGLKKAGIEGQVTGRPKHLWSIRQKLQRVGGDLNRLFDLLAFRIIVKDRTQCYEVLGLVHSLWQPIPGRFKDYISIPKANGYQSLHTAVIGPNKERLEIQIRTFEMHSHAEYGIASHWVYKENPNRKGKVGVPEGRIQQLWQDGPKNLQVFQDLMQEVSEPGEFLQALHRTLAPHEIFVYTRDGELKTFPRGATPIDFAYSVHTTLGHECTGAKVNGRIVQLGYEMRNGETVEILRTKGNRPKHDWLKLAKTSTARAKIRSELRREENELYVLSGRRFLEDELQRFGGSVNRAISTGELRKVAERLKHQDEKSLFLALGAEQMQPSTVSALLFPEEKTAKKSFGGGLVQRLIQAPRRLLDGSSQRKTEAPITVGGAEGIATYFPGCCSPLPGEPIVGYISTGGRGVAIHHHMCLTLEALDSKFKVDVSWAKDPEMVDAHILVESRDRIGLSLEVLQIFRDFGINMRNSNCQSQTDEGIAKSFFSITVKNIKQLNAVVNKIEQVKDVLRVSRVHSPQGN